MNRADILAKTKLPIERVEVPEWGGAVFVRTLTGTERDAFEVASSKGSGKRREVMLDNFRARLAVIALCDEEGVRLFGDDDVDEVAKLSGKALGRIAEVAQRLNGWTDDDIEVLEKN